MSSNPEIERAIAAGVEKIEFKAAQMAIETRQEIQEKSKKWVIASAGFLALALGLLTFFGIREIWQFQDQLQVLKNEANDTVEDLRMTLNEQSMSIKEDTESVISQLQESNDSLKQAQSEFDRQRESLEAINKNVSMADAALKQIRGLTDAYLTEQKRVDLQLEKIEKIQNSFFTVYLMYPGRPERLSKFLADLRSDGFNVSPENILNVTVDETEVIYYDESPSSQVDTVRQILQDAVSTPERTRAVAARFGAQRDPREILVKISAADIAISDP